MQNFLSVSLLGSLEINHSGQPVTGLVSRKTEALLAYLACIGQPVSRQVVATLLWEHLPQSRALANLSVHLTSLRKQLAPFLQTTHKTVGLNPASDYAVDMIDFERSVVEIIDKQQLFEQLSQSDARRLEQALNLYQGDFLAGFTLRRGHEFEAWASVQRERLHQLAVAAFIALIKYHLPQKQYRQGIAQASRLLVLDPLQEEGHRQLMQLLMCTGQSAAALAQYETCRRILAEELGVEPEKATVALYQQIQTSRQAGNVSKAKQAITLRQPAFVHNLPTQLTAFVGRKRELEQIDRYLDKDVGRLLTLIGPGGIGKTRLALQAADRKIGEFGDGVWFIPMTEAKEARFLVAAIADVIGLSISGPATPKLLNHLRNREQLLVLDSVEHLLNHGQAKGKVQSPVSFIHLIKDILQHAPRVKILITSRERLNLQAESLLRVYGLEYPAADKVENMAAYPALQLFRQSANRVNPSFCLSPETEVVVRDICQIVEGSPLGIELAAGWVNLLSPSEILAELRNGLDILETRVQDMPRRHRSMRSVFEQSWRLLAEDEKIALKKLAVFCRGFTRDLADFVADVQLMMLQRLTNKSLLRRDSSGQFILPQLTRYYVAEKLCEDT